MPHLAQLTGASQSEKRAVNVAGGVHTTPTTPAREHLHVTSPVARFSGESTASVVLQYFSLLCLGLSVQRSGFGVWGVGFSG